MLVIVNCRSPKLDQEIVLLKTLNLAFKQNVPRANLVHQLFFPFLSCRLFQLSKDISSSGKQEQYYVSADDYIAEESIEQSKEDDPMNRSNQLNLSLQQ